jgi:hypothetical protein
MQQQHRTMKKSTKLISTIAPIATGIMPLTIGPFHVSLLLGSQSLSVVSFEEAACTKLSFLYQALTHTEHPH